MTESEKRTKKKPRDEDDGGATAPASADAAKPRAEKRGEEVGGPKGLEPTRYGDWERKGRCVDF